MVFFDAFGVLKSSRGILQGAPDVLYRLTQENIECYVLTNDASRSPKQMSEVYIHPEHGRVLPEDHHISSGLLTADYLRYKIKTGSNVAYIGKPDSAYYIENVGLQAISVSDLQPEDKIEALVFLDDEGYDWFADINKAVNILRHVNVPVIVANPDSAYPVNKNEVSIAVGSLATMMENIIKKTFIRFGKPDTEIFYYAYDRVRKKLVDLNKSQILMVGDTLHTDILGANKFAIDTALVLSGNTQKERCKLMIESSGIIPTYVFDSILT